VRGDEEPSTGITLRRLAALPWVWPVPALGVQAVVLLASAQIWRDMVTVYSRGGLASRMSVAHRYLLLTGVVTGLYWILLVLGDSLFLGGSGRMRSPTEAEKGCVTALLRVGLLGALYFATWTMVRDYAG
jgi:hypothetical protein